MKHILQWKLIGIMLISLICGVTAIAITQAFVFGNLFGMTAEETEKATEPYTYIFDILFILVCIITFLILSRKVVKRIEMMSRNVEQIAKGNLDKMIEDNRSDELGNLSRNINTMAEDINGYIDKQKEMVCSVAHDLRTPVTSIKGYSELLKKSSKLTDEELSYISVIQEKSESLSKQIEELLEYSVLQFEEKKYDFSQISLSRLIEQVMVEFIPILDTENMTFSISGNNNDLMFECNQILMVRLFENLINNGIKYGKDGGKIDISLNEDVDNIYIEISNFTKELTSEEILHLFEAFYQGENASEYQTKSKGLGLAIAHKIVLVHNGTIEVENDRERGIIKFVICFPKSN